MKRKRSRLMLVGVLALALSVTVAGASGGVADAKKKGKRKSAHSFTVATTAPTAIPLGAMQGAVTRPGYVRVPIGPVGGKKLKGKVIGFNTLSVATTFSGGPGFARFVDVTLIAPDQRHAELVAPIPNNLLSPSSETVSGPTTETPDSVTFECIPFTSMGYTQPPCQDPNATLGPPYAGTIVNSDLERFGGISPRGTWTLKVGNSSTTVPATLNSVVLTGTLINALR